jgi:pyruvate formate lyase activating enzyme
MDETRTTTQFIAGIDQHTAPGVLFRERSPNAVECVACAHRCRLVAGARGICGVRFNDRGILRVPFGYVAARRVRHVETNTIYHVRPGALALTFGMYGCDLRCPYCHNWRLSQALRDPTDEHKPLETITASALVEDACRAGCRVICSAYNEPMITAEWAHAVFAEARRRGLITALISDANTTADALAYLRPVTDVFRADLKGYDEAQYRALGGRAPAALAAIAEAKRLGYWVEVVTLMVPGFNDSLSGLRSLASSLAAIDAEMPWHLNGFVPRYRMASTPATAPEYLVHAAGIAYGRGLRHVYVGNVADAVAELSHTRCPECAAVVVRRHNYRMLSADVAGSRCPSCRRPIGGIWTP